MDQEEHDSSIAKFFVNGEVFILDIHENFFLSVFCETGKRRLHYSVTNSSRTEQ